MINLTKEKLLSFLIYFASTSLGAISFLYPFFTPGLEQNVPLSEMRAGQAPLVYSLLVALCLLVILFEVQSQAVDVKLIALLGMLVAINAALRFIEVAIPGPSGFSPIFFLIILTGYVFGGRFGFLMGTLTLFASALITGGIGPWLPSQMFTVGWVGMSAPLCVPIVRLIHGEGKFSEILILVIFGALWGLLYGAIINLWSWPYIAGPSAHFYQPGEGWLEAVKHYSVFYMVTSFVWDLGRSFGNVLLILVAGSATLRALQRFKHRFGFSYQPMEGQTA